MCGVAIYHLHRQYVSRSAGRSSVALVAYRIGCKLHDEHYRQDHDYTHKDNVRESFILAPEDAPEWAHDHEKLWNAVEAREKRKDSQVAREYNVALPLELNGEAQRRLVAAWVQERFVDRGLVADVAIHEGTERTNPHAHVMLSTREIGPQGFGKKVTDWTNERQSLIQDRETWAKATNLELSRAGVEARIDHRTLEAQGINREPGRHLGPKLSREVKYLERELVAINRLREVELGRGNQIEVDRAGSRYRGAERGVSQDAKVERGAQHGLREQPIAASLGDVARELHKVKARAGLNAGRDQGVSGPKPGKTRIDDLERQLEDRERKEQRRRGKKHDQERERDDGPHLGR
jgi:ATP-dependent exoDNAse (exonuclease V) alpha subunit